MKIYKRYTAARKSAGELPIIKIAWGRDALFLVCEGDLVDVRLTEVSLITPDGGYAGNITMMHLDRLGNGNWAEAKLPSPYSAFTSDKAERREREP
jgi:hypothetical protein